MARLPLPLVATPKAGFIHVCCRWRAAQEMPDSRNRGSPTGKSIGMSISTLPGPALLTSGFCVLPSAAGASEKIGALDTKIVEVSARVSIRW